MSRAREVIVVAALWALAALPAGCMHFSNRTILPPDPPPGIEADPCAERLHELCERLLLYYIAHKELPQNLIELAKSGAGPALPLVCPVSRKPYAYNRDGVMVAGLPGALIVSDPEPSHGGIRWGIMAEPAQAGQPLILQVVPVPDKAPRVP